MYIFNINKIVDINKQISQIIKINCPNLIKKNIKVSGLQHNIFEELN